MGDVLAVPRVRPARLGRFHALHPVPPRTGLPPPRLGPDRRRGRRHPRPLAAHPTPGHGHLHRPGQGPPQTRPRPLLPPRRVHPRRPHRERAGRPAVASRRLPRPDPGPAPLRPRTGRPVRRGRPVARPSTGGTGQPVQQPRDRRRGHRLDLPPPSAPPAAPVQPGRHSMTTTTSRPEPPRPEQGTLLEPADPAAAPGRGENPSRHAVVERDTSDQARADASTRSPHAPSRAAGETRRRVCAWCTQPIPARARRDAICCSVRCRQARHRFGRTVGRARAVAGGHPRLRLAYADPPYPGKAWLYKDHPDYAGEVDHAALIRRLGPYDGWALSTSATALPAVLALCPPGVRVAAWHRGERPTASWWPLHAWEPVIYLPARPVDPSSLQTRRVDSLVHGVSPMTTLPGRVVGAKPAAFCRWVFDLLGATPQDNL